MAQSKKTASAGKTVKTVSKSGSSKNTSKSNAKSATKSTSKSQTSRSGAKQEIYNSQKDSSIYDEIIMIVLILLSVIVLLSLCTSVMGILGQLIDRLFKGLMGVSAFIMPLLVSSFALWWLFSKERRFAAAKIVGIVLFIVSVSALFQLITEKSGSFTLLSFGGRIKEFYNNGNGINGGVIGGVTAYYLNKFLGWGSYIVVIASIIVAVMLSTGKSLVVGISSIIGYANDRKRVKEAAIKAKAENIRIKEEKRARKREIEESKYENRVHKYKKGNFNITINGDEGLDSSLPAVNAVVFEKKEEPKEEKKEEIYDFCREVPEDDEERGLFAGERLIEVLGEVKSTDTDNESDGKKENNDSAPIIFGVFAEEPEIRDDETDSTDNIKPVEIEAEKEAHKAVKEAGDETAAQEIDFDDVISEKEPELEENEMSEAEEVNTENENTDIDVNSEVSEGYEFNAEEIEESAIEPSEINENTVSNINKSSASNKESAYDTNIKQNISKSTAGKINSEAEKAEGLAVPQAKTEVKKEYIFPPLELLGKEPVYTGGETKADMMENAKKLEDTLHSFGVSAKVVQINKGPTVTRYELTPSQGVKVSKIVNLSDDIALNLAATGIRIEAPIPGKAAVGIEVPNKEIQSVYMRTVLESDAFKNAESKLTFVLGKDIAGNCVVTDIAKMPHLLIAGATGSGKSVCINSIITSIIYKAKPEEVKLLLVDPKVVELSVYNGIPHLLIPVVTDPKKASGALNWAVKEMLARYNTFAECHVRDIKGYNAMKKDKGETDFMPQIVIIIDELADLMMAAPNEVEDSICRLAQLARAAGMHLIIATQRPSVDVITGVIKANIPSRIAFAVSSGIDSRTILDCVGAEKLLGKGDMLFYPMGKVKPVRIQGAFVTDKEVENIVDFIKGGEEAVYDSSVIEKITSSSAETNKDAGEEKDEFFDRAVELVISKEKASVSMIQRQFRIGYNRAARIVEEMESMGIVGPEEGSKPRKVLISSMEEYRGEGVSQNE